MASFWSSVSRWHACVQVTGRRRPHGILAAWQGRSACHMTVCLLWIIGHYSRPDVCDHQRPQVPLQPLLQDPLRFDSCLMAVD